MTLRALGSCPALKPKRKSECSAPVFCHVLGESGLRPLFYPFLVSGLIFTPLGGLTWIYIVATSMQQRYVSVKLWHLINSQGNEFSSSTGPNYQDRPIKYEQRRTVANEDAATAQLALLTKGINKESR